MPYAKATLTALFYSLFLLCLAPAYAQQGERSVSEAQAWAQTALSAKDVSVRMRAIDELIALQSDEALEALVLISSSDPAVSIRKRVMTLLLSAYDFDNEHITKRSEWTKGKVKNPEKLFDAYNQDSNETVRLMKLGYLAYLGVQKTYEPLAAELNREFPGFTADPKGDHQVELDNEYAKQSSEYIKTEIIKSIATLHRKELCGKLADIAALPDVPGLNASLNREHYKAAAEKAIKTIPCN